MCLCSKFILCEIFKVVTSEVPSGTDTSGDKLALFKVINEIRTVRIRSTTGKLNVLLFL